MDAIGNAANTTMQRMQIITESVNGLLVVFEAELSTCWRDFVTETAVA